MTTVVVTSLSAVVVPAFADTPAISLTALSWGQSHVDATAGTATDTLTFTVTDTDGATSLTGVLHIQEENSTSTGLLPDYYEVVFGPPPQSSTIPADGVATFVSGNVAESTYSYTFPVPRYGPGATAAWAVSSFSVHSTGAAPPLELDASALASAFPSGFTATAVSDTAGPTLVGVIAPIPYVFTKPGSPALASATYAVHVTDAQSGVSSVTVDLVGPGGAHLSGSAIRAGGSILTPGTLPQDLTVFVNVKFGSGQALGTWTVDEIDATDVAGNTSTFTGLSDAPTIHTDDSVLHMTGFTLNPNPVNAWTSAQTTTLSVQVTGPAPVTSVSLIMSIGCTHGTPSLPTTPNGTVTIPITVAVGTAFCHILWIGMTDSAGDGALYGFVVGVSPIPPDITDEKGPGPVVTNLHLDKSSVDWASGGTVTVTVDVSSWGPGVVGMTASAQGSVREHFLSGPSVTEPRLESGTVSATIPVPPHQDLDHYVVSVAVWDAAGVQTNYSANSTGFAVTGSNGVSAFVPEQMPVRVLDTRNGTGPLAGNQSRSVNPNVPAGATAVVLNVTATDPTAGSYLTAWPDGGSRPGVSNLNFTPGQTVPNLVTVPVGSNGLVDLYNHSGSVDVVVDVLGYYLPDGGGYFVPLTPSRVVDTRDGTGGVGAQPLTRGHPIPASLTLPPNPNFVSAVVLNVTVTDAASAGFLSVQTSWATPTTSNLNFVAGQTVANLVVVPDTTPIFYTNATSVDVVADLVGYYVTFSSVTSGSSVFVPATPSRVLDTRNGTGAAQGPLGPAGQTDVHVAGVPATASGAALNVTAVGGTANSYLTTWPNGQPRPGTSTVNFAPGAIVANLATVALGSDGGVDVWNHTGSVDVVADLFGYFLPTH